MFVIDTHCHLDATEFDQDRERVIAECHSLGVDIVVIPAVAKSNFDKVRQVAYQFDGGRYALGIHPMYVWQADEKDLILLEKLVVQQLSENDQRFVAIGEIGLDLFVSELKEGELREKQEFFFREQLKIAQRYHLPVLLHVRRAQDLVLKYLRQIKVYGGIAHAFNGSLQQAKQFIHLNFCLGFGGAMTFDRARQIRRLASEIDLSYIVLETDAPDIPPAWLTEENKRNSPTYLVDIAASLAHLRGDTLAKVAKETTRNAQRVLPRLLTRA